MPAMMLLIWWNLLQNVFNLRLGIGLIPSFSSQQLHHFKTERGEKIVILIKAAKIRCFYCFSASVE